MAPKRLQILFSNFPSRKYNLKKWPTANISKVLLLHTEKKDWDNWKGKEAIFAQSTEGGGGGWSNPNDGNKMMSSLLILVLISLVFTQFVCVQAAVQAAPVCKQLQNKPPPFPHPRTQTHTKTQEMWARIFKRLKDPRHRFHRIDSASLCSLAVGIDFWTH